MQEYIMEKVFVNWLKAKVSGHLFFLSVLLTFHRHLPWISSSLFTRSQPNWRGFLEDQSFYSLKLWHLFGLDSCWNYVWLAQGNGHHCSGWRKEILSACSLLEYISCMDHWGAEIWKACCTRNSKTRAKQSISKKQSVSTVQRGSYKVTITVYLPIHQQHLEAKQSLHAWRTSHAVGRW